MEKVIIKTEYIKLDQLLKWAGLYDNGAEAKDAILNGQVKVNGDIELRRGRKIRPDDIVDVLNKKLIIVSE